jgi:NADH:ubiquinone oxidoreductase subunit H
MFFKYLAFESLIKDKKDDYYYYLLPIQILFNAFVFFGGIPFVIFNIRKTIKLYTQMKFDMWLWKESGITFYIKKPSEYN